MARTAIDLDHGQFGSWVELTIKRSWQAALGHLLMLARFITTDRVAILPIGIGGHGFLNVTPYEVTQPIEDRPAFWSRS